ncbi:MAG: serine/threonine protein kinase [Alphaproteobacteria bacterium]|nr:serine/threonine protein kinase [Alphaproteobacteria bacterium]MCB9696682.1 serine/threonine protein kinase [Alphaproteobacteria bacterium]
MTTFSYAGQDGEPVSGEHVWPTRIVPDVVDDRYEVDHYVGRGGMSLVYQVRDRRDGGLAALKVLRPDLIHRSELVSRLATEAVTMVVLDHPHVVHVRDMGTDPESALWYVVTDWAPGGSASLRVRRSGPIDAVTAARWGVELCSALATAHARGIYHRDVKPGNLLIGARGEALLADFGVALVPDADSETEAGVTLGTMSTMPPEQRRTPADIGPTADLYALGATLYQVTTGDNPIDLFLSAEGDPRWDRVDAGLRPVLFRATRADPGDRYATALDMARDLAPMVPEPVWEEEPWLAAWLRPAS